MGPLDFDLLRKQKLLLLQIIDDENATISAEQHEALSGIICLIDAIQDEAVDSYGLPEEEVFHFTDKINIMATNKHWMSAALDSAQQHLYKEYEHIYCEFEIGDDQRHISYLKCVPEQPDDVPRKETMILLVITNQGRNASVMLYKQEFIAGWPCVIK